MIGLHPFPRTDAEDRENWRTLIEVADELYFKPTMVPGTGYFGAGVNLSVATGTASVEFTNGAAVAAWRAEMRRRSRWRNARVRITITYTAVAGSTNGFHLAVILREHGPGDVIPGTAMLATGFTMPGPAVALTEMAYTYVSPGVAVNGAKPGLAFVVARDPTAADDINANSLHVLSVEWEILPL